MKRPLALLAALLLILLMSWSLRTKPPAEVGRTALIMGTLVEIKAVGQDEDHIERVISEAFKAMQLEESRFSTKIATSQVSVINRSSAAIDVDPEVTELLQRGQRITAASQGAFHMGLGGLVSLWDFEAVTPNIPTQAEINTVLPALDGEVIKISDRQVERSNFRVQLDLGGIAKGYAVDRAIDVLRRAGIASASVNAGGDIGLLGGHGERPWKIGIQHPRKTAELLATLELVERSIVTSGDYERFFMRDGVRYHHIFDPQTGLPARGCQSVSVVAASAAEADALATAVFVLGPIEGLALLEHQQDVEGIIVAADGKIAVSSGLKDQVQWR